MKGLKVLLVVAVVACIALWWLVIQNHSIAVFFSAKDTRPGELLSLRLEPENLKLWGAKASQQFLVLGKYSDGLERDVTLESRFSVSDTKVLEVDKSGRVAGLADGGSLLTAEFEGQSAKTQVRVVW